MKLIALDPLHVIAIAVLVGTNCFTIHSYFWYVRDHLASFEKMRTVVRIRNHHNVSSVVSVDACTRGVGGRVQ